MKKVVNLLTRFHRDEQGPPEMGTVLLVALIVIPLIVVIIIFSQEITELFGTAWEKLTGTDPAESPF